MRTLSDEEIRRIEDKPGDGISRYDGILTSIQRAEPQIVETNNNEE